jgi:hypothetical protein
MLDDLQDGLNSAMGLDSMFLWYILGELVPVFWTSTRNGLSHYALLNGLLPDRYSGILSPLSCCSGISNVLHFYLSIVFPSVTLWGKLRDLI